MPVKVLKTLLDGIAFVDLMQERLDAVPIIASVLWYLGYQRHSSDA